MIQALTIPQALQIALQHHKAGQIAGAEGLYRQILAVQPDHADALHMLGLLNHQAGRQDGAADLIRQAIAANPAGSQYHVDLGNILSAQGRMDEAIDAYRGALAVHPDYAMAHNNLGSALNANGRVDEAVEAYRRALQINPDYEDAHSNLALVLIEKLQFAAAVDACRRALEIKPNHLHAWFNLGNALKNQGHLDEAVDAYRRALRIKPNYTAALNNLGTTLKHQGYVDDAIACCRRAMQSQPGFSPFHDNYLATLHYCPETTLAGLFEAHIEYERLHAAPRRAAWRPHLNAPDPDRQLRIGFISPHFATHPVGRFLIRPLENLDPGQFHVTCYSDARTKDQMTARIQSAVSVWRDVASMNDEQLAALVREDRVDILFDLAGHTAGNRLRVFGRKPAPIQITWLDYVGTTGLAAMDYILADARQIPHDAEPWYREKVLRMPDDYICYDPPGDAPPVGPLPALENGSFTFASFNIPAKISPKIIAVWARILHRAPHARLMLMNRGMDDPGTGSRYRRLFAEHGIGAERLELRGWSPPNEVLACYNQVDVALDTFPYNGGLTTCEAMWMGVPVVTCPGETFASRHGLTHLSAAGAPETLAGNLEQYEEIAVELAGDLKRLAAIRAGLRPRVAASPLCDGKRFATHLTRILRGMWRQWALHH